MKFGIKSRQAGQYPITETPQMNTPEVTQNPEIIGKYPKKVLITTDGKDIDIAYMTCSSLELIGICKLLLDNFKSQLATTANEPIIRDGKKR